MDPLRQQPNPTDNNLFFNKGPVTNPKLHKQRVHKQPIEILAVASAIELDQVANRQQQHVDTKRAGEQLETTHYYYHHRLQMPQHRQNHQSHHPTRTKLITPSLRYHISINDI